MACMEPNEEYTFTVTIGFPDGHISVDHLDVQEISFEEPWLELLLDDGTERAYSAHHVRWVHVQTIDRPQVTQDLAEAAGLVP